jgi:hypothetical protein
MSATAFGRSSILLSPFTGGPPLLLTSLQAVLGRLVRDCAEVRLYRVPGSSAQAREGQESTDAPALPNVVSGTLSEVLRKGPKIWPPGRCAELRKCPIVS